MRKKIILLIFLLFALFINRVTFAAECRCTFKQDQPPKAELKRSDSVFIGEVVKITEPQNKEDLLKVAFLVSKHYKGPVDTNIIVYTPKDENCRYDFEKGETYLVYTIYKDEVLYTDRCTRTCTVNQAKVFGDINRLQALGFGKENKNNEYSLMQDPFLQAAYYSDAVFYGDVIKIEPSEKKGLLAVTINFVRLIRGWLDGRVIVHTPKEGGYEFKVGEKYIIFADYKDGVLYVDKVKDFWAVLRSGEADGIITSGYTMHCLNGCGFGAHGWENSPGNRLYTQEKCHHPGGKRIDYDALDFTRLFDAFKEVIRSYYPEAEIITSQDGFLFRYNTRFYKIRIPTETFTNWGRVSSGESVVTEGPRKGGVTGSVFVYLDWGVPEVDLRPIGSNPPEVDFSCFGQTFQLKSFAQPFRLKDTNNKQVKRCYLHIRLFYYPGRRLLPEDISKEELDKWNLHLGLDLEPKDLSEYKFFDSFLEIANNFDSYVDIDMDLIEELWKEKPLFPEEVEDTKSQLEINLPVPK